ncbi:MAG: tRNA (adenosine(37)-N6)-threonylcarbamoyltransferase complex dimerization subunit type 1 TsaB [bacterium]|nr:tRNA (adenosine(37)-N6)-threonylcarbamoyltransferase complex dimerization subunit type 1 TsaB [bacterium]
MTTERQFDNVLAIETSTPELKLALSFGEDRIVTATDQVDRSHGQVIVRKMTDLFNSAGGEVKQLEGIVVSSGPGSFTGLRIGLAIAKGMASALSIPIASVSLYEVAAFLLRNHPEPVLVMIQVRRGEYLVATVKEGNVDLHAVDAVPEERLKEYLNDRPVAGIGLDLNRLIAGANVVVPRINFGPADLHYIGRHKLQIGEFADIGKLEPLYYGKSQAELRFDQRHGQAGQ